MKKKNITALSIAYVVAHLIFMPTYEVDKGFFVAKKSINGAMISAELTGAYRETNSRILNIAKSEGPYYIQTAIEIFDDQYDAAAFESIILINVETKDEIIVLGKSQLVESFRTYSDRPSIVGFASNYNMQTQQGNIILNYNSYLIRMRIRACIKDKCEVLEFEELLEYRVKRKFYSNSFANMMGI